MYAYFFLFIEEVIDEEPKLGFMNKAVCDIYIMTTF